METAPSGRARAARHWRLFIAHPMPPDARSELAAQLASYRRAHPDARWTRPESWHLTLLFLGSVAPDRCPELERLIAQVAARSEPYRVVVDRGGGRLRRQDGVAWLGLSEGAGRLIELATNVVQGCPDDITEGAPPKRTPSAHLTVARHADGAVLQALRTRSLGPLGVSWRVRSMALVRSHLQPDGAHYETLREVTL